MTDSVFSAREYFPRGLYQPEGSFRFSADALLLAAFAVRRCLPVGRGSLLDLGCGCGVVGLACLLAVPDLAVTGIELDPDLAAAARTNAVRLGLEERFAVTVLDLAAPDAADRIAPRIAPRILPGAYDVVTANMPFRSPKAGRVPPSASRARALFADDSTMMAFLGNAARALAENGRLALVYPLSGLERLLRSLEDHGFSPLAVLPVMASRDDAARVLVAAGRAHGQNSPVRRETPLSLFATPGGPYTEEALAFCPWLASRPWA